MSKPHATVSLLAATAALLLGLVLGLTLRADPAAAQTAAFHECFVGRQESVDINDEGRVERPRANRLIQIPRGWVVVCGGGGPQGGLVVFCH